MTGKCKLCGHDPVELRDSHIISHWLYRRLHSFPGDVTGIIETGDGRSGYRCLQQKKHLLCDVCEGIIARSEVYASSVAVQPDGVSFPALDAAVPICQHKQKTLLDLSRLDTDALTHFGASIFWRADIADIEPITHLGAARRESLRAYLHGETGFPDDIELIVYLLEDDQAIPAHRILSLPVTSNSGRKHDCVLLGFRFALYSPSIPELAPASLPRAKKGLRCSTREIASVIAPKLQESKLYGKLAKESEET